MREQDFPLAAVARDRLFDLGWRVEHDPPQTRQDARQTARGQGGDHVS
ncbi:MAG TPA: hypothetical protein VFF52_12000 [Isosphaeraceae bacterium]|nr:hypothetical protein [Isosphaeraceae bacterium]